VLGKQILEILPYAPIALRMRTGVAALSYCDQLTFGISSDYDSVPEVDVLGRAIADGITELVDAARATAPATPRAEIRTRRPVRSRARATSGVAAAPRKARQPRSA
jgi:diacylglycerol O-acyltransferase